MGGPSEAPETRREAPPPPSPVEERPIGLHDYLDVFRRQWRLVAGAFFAALAVAVAVSLTMPPVYRASTTVTTDKTPALVLLQSASGTSLSADQTAGQAPDVSTLAELIKSDAVREGAMSRLAREVGTEVARAALVALAVQQVRQSELVRISIEYTDPRVAAQAANDVADSLIDVNLRGRRRRATETRQFIDRELQEASQRLRDTEEVLATFRDRNRDVSLTQETHLNLQKLADLRAQLVDVRLQRDAEQLRLAAAREGVANEAKPSPLIAPLQDQLAKLEIELSGLRRQFTAKHPAIKSTIAKIDETKQRLNAEERMSFRTEEATIAALKSRERALQDVMATYEGLMRGVPLRELYLARLTRDAKESERTYLLLSERSEQARIAENSIGSVIRVVDAAQVPTAPVKPRRQMNTLFGGLLGLMVGVAAAFLVEMLDDTVKSVEEIERVLGAPVLGAIPVVSGARPPGKQGTRKEETAVLELAVTDRYSPAAEAYRTLRTHVLFSMPDVERKRLLVTSALAREGKSTVVANLAVAIASTDRRVWLIDGDMRRPALWRWFGGASSPGLAGLLAGQTEVDSVLRPAAEPNLWYVESGPAAPNPAELLGSQRMVRLMERARAEADVVLVDSPPMLAVSDAGVVAGQAVDGVLLVVKAGETSKRTLAYVRKRLEQVGAKLVGAVLNCVPNRGREGYYYGSYYDADYGSKGKDASGGKGESERKNGRSRRGDS